jgi:hypothetical protein
MGVVDRPIIDLLQYQVVRNAAGGQATAPPPTEAATGQEGVEDIISSVHPTLLGATETGQGMITHETDDDVNSDEESNDETDTSESEDDVDYAASHGRSGGSVQLQIPTIPDSRRPSPKRRRTNDDVHDALYQTPPTVYTPYNGFPTNNGQAQTQTLQLGNPGHATSLANYQMPLLTQHQNGMGGGQNDPFTSFELSGATQNYEGPAFQPTHLQNMLPEKSRGRIRHGSPSKKPKSSKGVSNGKSSSRRRKTVH